MSVLTRLRKFFVDGKAKQVSGQYVLCSNCFSDQGIRLDAERIGETENSACPACGVRSGRKLTKDRAAALAHRFFVWGTLHKCEYGAAPLVQFNEHRQTSINAAPWFQNDLELISKTLTVGFFYYGPRLWMVGEVEPLKALQEEQSRQGVIQRILNEYPSVILDDSQSFYRIQKIRKHRLTRRNTIRHLSVSVALAGWIQQIFQSCMGRKILRYVYMNAV